MNTIVAGSRKGVTLKDVWQAMKDAPWDITAVLSGKAKGADELGETIAKAHHIPVYPYPADWKNIDVPGAIIRKNQYGTYNMLAGHQRNEKMAKNADALIAIWDGKSKGTADMIKRAKRHDLKIYVHYILK